MWLCPIAVMCGAAVSGTWQVSPGRGNRLALKDLPVRIFEWFGEFGFCGRLVRRAGRPPYEIGELIVSLNEKRKMTAVLVTHDIYGAKSFSDRLIVMRDGKVLVEGTFAELQKSEDSHVVQFLKDSVRCNAIPFTLWDRPSPFVVCHSCG